MDLFSLVAKLTLDASDFDAKIAEAKKEAESFDVPEPVLSLDSSEFESKINDANSAEVESPDTPELDLDNSEFKKSIEDAQSSGESFGSIMGQVFDNVKTALITSGVTAAITGIVNYFRQGAQMAANTGDTIDKQSQAMLLSAEAYQEWDYALKLAGTDITALQRGMKNWQQTIGSGEESEEDLAASFEKLGINAEDAFEKIKSGENLDDLLTQALYALADYNGSDKGALQEALFGKNSTGLNALLNQSSGELSDIIDQAHEFGLIMSDEDVANAASYTDAITTLNQATKSLQEALGATLLPMLTEVANKLAVVVSFFNPRSGTQTLSEMFFEDDQEFAEQLSTIESTADVAENLADKLIAMGDTSTMTANQYAIWEATAKRLIDLVPSLGSVIDTESGQISANSAEIKENIKQWENLAKQKALQSVKEEKMMEIAEKNKELVSKSVEAQVKLSEAETKRGKAVESLNNLMDEFGLGEEWYLADNATEADIAKIGTRLSIMAGMDTGKLKQVQDTMALFGDWTNMNKDVADAQAEVEDITAEVEAAQEEYEKWEQAFDGLYGTMAESADDSKESVDSATESVGFLQQALDNLPVKKSIDVLVNYIQNGGDANSHAIGSEYIPYDNYPALLHRGEKVLTATEARQESTSSTDYSGMEESIVAAIRSGMANATVNSYINGKKVTDEVNRNNTNDLKSRRYRT